MGIRILGTGSYLPPKVVTNDDLAKVLDTSDEWIFSHTGIHRRHVAGTNETASTMAAEAAKSALAAAEVSVNEIGLVIVATSTPDYATFPSTACIVQEMLGCANAGAFDLQAACAGFVYALEQARGYVSLHPAKKALVIGVECLSRILDWADRSSCILFGDGAGAVVIGGDGRLDVDSETFSFFGSDGGGKDLIKRTGGTREALSFDPASGVPVRAEPISPKLTLMGHEVFAFALRVIPRIVNNLCEQRGITVDAIDRVFAHQANGRIVEAVARRMKLPLEKFWLNIAETANTSAASVPISLDQAVRSGALADGMKIVMTGFGSGLCYGGIYCVWPRL